MMNKEKEIKYNVFLMNESRKIKKNEWINSQLNSKTFDEKDQENSTEN